MHHFVFSNHLPETILELADYEETDGHSLLAFLKSGQVPALVQDPNMPRFHGVIGQSMTAPLLFLMRELRRLNVLDHRFDSACYYMNSPARRVASRLQWISDDVLRGSTSVLADLSNTVHDKMRQLAPELVRYFDLPLQLYAQEGLR